MENTYAKGISLENRFDKLFLDESKDPLEAAKKNAKKKTMKIKQTKLEKTKPATTSNTIKPPIQVNKKVYKIKKTSKAGTNIPVNTQKYEVVPLRQVTLEEYRAEFAALRGLREPPTYNLRQPGEGEDLSQWGNLVPLVKTKNEEKPAEEDFGCKTPWLAQRASRRKHLSVAVTFGDSISRAERCQRGKTLAHVVSIPMLCPQSSRDQQRPPRCDNEEEFPSLVYENKNAKYEDKDKDKED